MEYKADYLFWSFKTKSTWRILSLTSEEVKMIEFIPEAIYPSVTPRSSFDLAIEKGIITFDHHEYQNNVIDAFRNHVAPIEAYAKKKHWGGTR